MPFTDNDNKKRQPISPKRMRFPNKWSLVTLPPKQHEDVGPFFYKLFEEAMSERERLGLPERWVENYKLFRGNHWQQPIQSVFSNKKSKLSLNILGANIQRTVANITARSPVAECKAADGMSTEAEDLMSEKLRLWAADEKQQASLTSSVLNQEIYGLTVEKAVYDRKSNVGYSIPLSPFAFLAAPGNWRELNDSPYLIHLYTMDIDACEQRFNVKGIVESEDLYSIFGAEREEERIVPAGTNTRSINASGNYVPTKHPKEQEERRYRNRCLVMEIWIRDNSKKKVIEQQAVIDTTTGQPLIDPNTGEMLMEEISYERYVYPGGIRVVTVTNAGNIVLDDTLNPNINPELPEQVVQNTYLYDRFPFYHSNSYEDTDSWYGFSMAELVGDINLAIDDLWSQIVAYLKMILFPPLILPKDTGIDKSSIRYRARLVMQPNSAATAQGIRWLDMPAPPSWIFQALDTLLAFFDRISQIEDADRGNAPKGVVAASAISQLQERGAVLMRAKIRAVDHLVRERGRCFISFFQNFGTDIEVINVDDTPMQVQGINMSQFSFNYVVESGSTVAKTDSQERQEAIDLYQMGGIDRQALLEKVKFDDWKKVIERMGEQQLDEAFNILIQAGMPEDAAIELRQVLMQPQGGPGNTAQTPPGTQGGKSVQGRPGAPPREGIPKAQQGGQRNA